MNCPDCLSLAVPIEGQPVPDDVPYQTARAEKSPRKSIPLDELASARTAKAAAFKLWSEKPSLAPGEVAKSVGTSRSSGYRWFKEWEALGR